MLLRLLVIAGRAKLSTCALVSRGCCCIHRLQQQNLQLCTHQTSQASATCTRKCNFCHSYAKFPGLEPPHWQTSPTHFEAIATRNFVLPKQSLSSTDAGTKYLQQRQLSTAACVPTCHQPSTPVRCISSHTKYAAGACSITIAMHVVRPHAYSQGPTCFNQPRSHEHSLPASTVCTSRPSSSRKTGALQIAPPSALPTTPRALRRSRSQHPFTHTNPPAHTAPLHPELATRGRHR